MRVLSKPHVLVGQYSWTLCCPCLSVHTACWTTSGCGLMKRYATLSPIKENIILPVYKSSFENKHYIHKRKASEKKKKKPQHISMGRLPAPQKYGIYIFFFLFSCVYFLKFWWKQLEHRSSLTEPDTWDVGEEKSWGECFPVSPVLLQTTQAKASG